MKTFTPGTVAALLAATNAGKAYVQIPDMTFTDMKDMPEGGISGYAGYRDFTLRDAVLLRAEGSGTVDPSPGDLREIAGVPSMIASVDSSDADAIRVSYWTASE